MTRRPGTAFAALAALGATGVLAACGSDENEPEESDEGPVTLSVVSLPPGSEPAAFEAFDQQVADFEEKNADIDIEAQEYEWEAPTFAAQLAGGTLPTVFEIPFTDGKALIENGQLADLSEQVESLPYADEFNPNVLDAGQDEDGNVFGLPKEAYGIGLQYNRTLFEQAGLDPDQPPTTWDEIREYAKQISEATGKAGYAQMTRDNTGGWMLTTLTYALGGRMQEPDGDSYQATLDNPQTKEALQKLQEMRWADNSMGSEFLYDWGGINQAFAAGQIGMYMGGSDVYTSLKRENNITPADYGLAVLPLDSSSDAGILGGGTLIVASAKASEAEKNAAIKWIDYYYMRKQTDQDAAVLDAKTLADSGQPVGTPKLPVFNKEMLDQSLEWIAEYINVPLDQMTSFTDGVYDQQLVAEPAAHTQELYAALDAVVQTILTDQNADVDQLLATANDNVQRILDQG